MANVDGGGYPGEQPESTPKADQQMSEGSPSEMEEQPFNVTLPGGKSYSITLPVSGNVVLLREGVEKQHGVPPACILKLFQDGALFLDDAPLKQIDAAQPVFAVIARETKLEVLLQACGQYWGYQDVIKGAVQNTQDPKTTIAIPPLPDIITVLEDMGGKAPEFKCDEQEGAFILRKGSKDGTLEFAGADGALILPSIDGKELLEAAGVDKFASVTMCIEVNSNAYNQGLGVVLEASPLMDTTVDEHGLPSYVYNGLGISEDKKQNAIKFHPGMGGGQLRIEGVGGWGNKNVGFLPKSWSSSGEKYHTLELTLGADGKNDVQIMGTEDNQDWRKPWTRQLTEGRYFPAVYAWLDNGRPAAPLQIRNLSMRVNMAA